NAKLTPSEITRYGALEKDAESLLAAAGNRHSFSPRSIASCIKLARTVADLKGEAHITAESMETALSYRQAGGMAAELGML
ncbi:MAG: ATP-binding protein, partial [Treponema sp.]|nr:ATP-binding protein [Treponema sp.]